MNINEKELVKQIKSAKRQLIWSIQDNVHYITNRHWAVRFDKLPTAVLTTLFSIFAEFPKNNESSMQFWYGMDEPVNGALVNIAKNMLPTPVEEGIITNIIQVYGDRKLRVISCGDNLRFVNNDYIQMIFAHEKYCFANAGMTYFGKGDLIICPIHMKEITHKEIIQDLIAM